MRYPLTSTALLSALLLATYALPGFAQTARAVPVTVQNLPAVQAVKEVNNPALQPVQFTTERTTTIDAPTVLFAGLRTDPPVPAGKRLVVQHLSYTIMSRDMSGDPRCSARVFEGTDIIVEHPLPIRADAVTGSGLEVATISQAMTLYANPGQTVGVSCVLTLNDSVTQTIGITGYYIDIDID